MQPISLLVDICSLFSVGCEERPSGRVEALGADSNWTWVWRSVLVVFEDCNVSFTLACLSKSNAGHVSLDSSSRNSKSQTDGGEDEIEEREDANRLPAPCVDRRHRATGSRVTDGLDMLSLSAAASSSFCSADNVAASSTAKRAVSVLAGCRSSLVGRYRLIHGCWSISNRVGRFSGSIFKQLL